MNRSPEPAAKMGYSSRSGIFFAAVLLLFVTGTVHLGALGVPTGTRPACRDCARAASAEIQDPPCFASRLFRDCCGAITSGGSSNRSGALVETGPSSIWKALSCCVHKQLHFRQHHWQDEQQSRGASAAAPADRILFDTLWRGLGAHQYAGSKGGMQQDVATSGTMESVGTPSRTTLDPYSMLGWPVGGHGRQQQQHIHSREPKPLQQGLLNQAMAAAAGLRVAAIPAALRRYNNRRMLLQTPRNPREITLADINADSDGSLVVNINIPVPPKPPLGPGGEDCQPQPDGAGCNNITNSSIPIQLVSWGMAVVAISV